MNITIIEPTYKVNQMTGEKEATWPTDTPGSVYMNFAVAPKRDTVSFSNTSVAIDNSYTLYYAGSTPPVDLTTESRVVWAGRIFRISSSGVPWINPWSGVTSGWVWDMSLIGVYPVSEES